MTNNKPKRDPEREHLSTWKSFQTRTVRKSRSWVGVLISKTSLFFRSGGVHQQRAISPLQSMTKSRSSACLAR